MQTTTPAVVAQAAVKRLPRAALLGLCIAYVLAGFVGRGGWKSADMTALGFMAERLLARPLTHEERKIISANADELLAHYKARPQEAAKLLAVGEMKPDKKIDPPTLAAYTLVANELMNLDEVLNK